jgi:predicted acetyltransferase
MVGEVFERRRPSPELVPSFERMRDAVLRTGYDGWKAPGSAAAHTDVYAYVDAIQHWAKGEQLPRGWVPGDIFWIVEREGVVGEMAVRHRLTDYLREVGGHIGYLTHPEHRNRGVATFALREGLKVIASLGIGEALVTCLDTNVASARVIEKCGGVRIEDSSLPGPKRRRYVISL